jgi:hypothetical protein
MASQTRLTEEHAQLLRRILASHQFAHADILKRILRYLVDRSADPDAPPPKEYELAVNAMGRPSSFDPRTDPIVRVSVGSIRERLSAYFGTEGREEPLRMEIPKGQYRVVFTPGAPGRQASDKGASALMRFWEPYFGSQAGTVIVYTEPLFFRDGARRFVRDWSVNSLETGAAEIRNRFPCLDSAEIFPVFHYLSAGEVHCLLSISRMFHELGIPIETRSSRNTTWHELSHCNLILLGSPRTNPFLESLQGDSPLIVREHHIEDASTPAGEDPMFCGRRFKDGRLNRMTEYAVVSRRPGVVENCCITVIAANHGRAIEGAGHVLTLEDRVFSVLSRMQVAGEDPVPEWFQLLMKVETIDIDDEVTSVECLRHHILPSR